MDSGVDIVYIPAANRETDPSALRRFIRQNPFCALVTMSAHGIIASHIPIVLHDSESGFGILRGHVARGNFQWRDFNGAVESLAIFIGPHHFISASWYPGKKTHGREVPTWNYVAVHAYGQLRAIEDPDWILEHVRSLTDQQEVITEVPWKVSDAPPEFIAKTCHAIVGLELRITRVEGSWKVSQNRQDEEALAVIDGLDQVGTTESAVMSNLIRERRPLATHKVFRDQEADE